MVSNNKGTRIRNSLESWSIHIDVTNSKRREEEMAKKEYPSQLPCGEAFTLGLGGPKSQCDREQQGGPNE